MVSMAKRCWAAIGCLVEVIHAVASPIRCHPSQRRLWSAGVVQPGVGSGKTLLSSPGIDGDFRMAGDRWQGGTHVCFKRFWTWLKWQRSRWIHTACHRAQSYDPTHHPISSSVQGDRGCAKASEFNAQAISSMAWAFAEAGAVGAVGPDLWACRVDVENHIGCGVNSIVGGPATFLLYLMS